MDALGLYILLLETEANSIDTEEMEAARQNMEETFPGQLAQELAHARGRRQALDWAAKIAQKYLGAANGT